MYVDPQIKKFVDDLTAENPPHPVDMGLDAAREGFSQLWQAVAPPVRDLARNDHITIAGPRGDISCKV